MAGARVQLAVAGSNTAVGSIAVGSGAGLAATTAGNTLVALCHLRTGATQSVTSVTDSASNTWALDVSTFLSGQNTKVEIWRCASAASVTTVTGTWSTTLISSMYVAEISGVTGTVVTAGAGAAASTTPAAVTVAAPGNAPVIGGITYPNATAPTALASPFAAETGFSAASGPSYHANAIHVPASATTEGPAWTLPASVASGAATIAFTAAATASDRVQNRLTRVPAAVTRAANF